MHSREEERRWLARMPSPEELATLQAHFPIVSSAARTPKVRPAIITPVWSAWS